MSSRKNVITVQQFQATFTQCKFLWLRRLTVRLTVLLGRVALVRGGADYSHQTFPWTICRSVSRSSTLWKTVGSDPDAVWHHSSGESMDEAGSGVWDRSTERGTFKGEFGARHCNQWRLHSVRVRQCLNRRSCRLGWCVRVGCITWGPHRARGRGDFGDFPHFHNAKCHWVADGEMFPIRIQKLDNISVRQTYRWKALFVGFLAIYSVSRSTSGFMRN